MHRGRNRRNGESKGARNEKIEKDKDNRKERDGWEKARGKRKAGRSQGRRGVGEKSGNY